MKFSCFHAKDGHFEYTIQYLCEVSFTFEHTHFLDICDVFMVTGAILKTPFPVCKSAHAGKHYGIYVIFLDYNCHSDTIVNFKLYNILKVFLVEKICTICNSMWLRSWIHHSYIMTTCMLVMFKSSLLHVIVVIAICSTQGFLHTFSLILLNVAWMIKLCYTLSANTRFEYSYCN